MSDIPPQQLADMWYLKFEYGWISHSTLDAEWRAIAKTLQKSNKIDYVLVAGSPNLFEEIYKLKESHANY
jgi:hypothetical protein